MNITVLFATLRLILSGCISKHPKVLLKTSLSDIVEEIYTDKAPVTAANFLKYVDNRRFKDALFIGL